ncbi:hypothetical protein Q1695_012473 [Nippostrongylus brasiliensis]|nr:hypothetical protein Q1695_012473 [Nippostrongylus brasiliensis]
MEFDDNSKHYKLLTLVHVKHAAVLSGLIGIFATVAFFSLGVAYFPWAQYDTSFDSIALIGFLVFLVSGTSVHYMILHAIYFTKFRFVMPFLIYHAFLISLNAITALIAVGELVADQNPQVDASDITARAVLLVMPIVCCFEALMVVIVMKVRTYLKDKRRHIRNGLPPPIREVIRQNSLSMINIHNKVYAERQTVAQGVCSSAQDLAHDKN